MLIALFLGLNAFSQSAKIIGTITNQSGQPLPGSSILVKGTNNGTTTNANGQYTISVQDSKSAILVFRSLGYLSQEVKISDKKEINIVLKEESSHLGDVVVIGYGTQSRTLLTTSVSKLDQKVLQNIPYSNATQALEGTIPGLRVQTTSGQPGTASRVILRGGTSINNPDGSAPLYIVDGVIRPNIDNISAGDIASLQVLKDAAATAIYGARGSNGVVIITTKSGEPGKMQVNYSFDLTVSHHGRLLQYASAKDYIYYGRLSALAASIRNPSALTRLTLADGFGTGNDLTNHTAYTTQYLTPDNQYLLKQGWQSLQDPIDPSKTIIYKATNYQNLIYRTAISQNHYLSASGGTDKATYYMGVGYLLGEGTALSTNYRRLSLNFNGTLQVANNLKITSQFLYADTKSDAVSSIANVFYRSASLPGTAKFKFQDSTMAPGQSSSIGNPLYYLTGPYALKGDNDYNNMTVALSANWQIVPKLSFKPSLSMYKAQSYGFSFQPAYLNGVSNFVTSRNANGSNGVTTQYQANGILDYLTTFSGGHNLDAMAGISYWYRQNYSLSASGNGASTDLIPTLNASALPVSVNGNQSSMVIQGMFYRINYNYKAKYLLSLDGRYDGASNLGAKHRYGFFPGVSAGWNIYKEPFWQNIFPNDLVDLKLRSSYGVNGNISGLGDFQAEGSYSVGNRYDNGAAVQPSVIPNQNLEWEQSQTFDAGLDLSLLNGRFSTTFDYFDRVTKNLLTTVSLPLSSGFSSVFTNLGSLGNKGIELELNAQILPDKSPFQWNISFNVATVNSKILKLPDNGVPNNRIGGYYVWNPSQKQYEWEGGLQEGGRIGDMYTFKYLGVYPTDKDASKAPYNTVITFRDKTEYGGDAIFADLDGNDTINTRDMVYVGNPYPTVTGGFSSTFSYKNLSLYVRMDYMAGQTIFDYAEYFADAQLQGDALPTAHYIKVMWKKQGDHAELPKYVWSDGDRNFMFPYGTSYYYQKGNFLALREVTLSYVLPRKLLKRIGIQGVRLNLSGQNLHYFTRYRGSNPEDGGRDNGHYPIPVNFIFGAKISL